MKYAKAEIRGLSLCKRALFFISGIGAKCIQSHQGDEVPKGVASYGTLSMQGSQICCVLP